MATILEIQNVCKQYNGKTILDHASFSIAANEIIALVGKKRFWKKALYSKLLRRLLNQTAVKLWRIKPL
ncbi:hypothetical protein OL548_13920 [Lysinibacillus sp. MHQ-1]|nr:hypothetical protein OL548_13920 [Lysinibacillus sp. MHQ-1]